MPTYSASGEENLRANPSVKSATPISSPAGAGKSVGGTENLRANQQTFDGGDKPLPTTYRHDVPPGLQSFDDNGQNAGGTKYLGR